MMRRIVALTVFILLVTAPAHSQDGHLGLPTPKEFFKTYDVDREGLQLLQEFLGSLDPQTREMVTKLVQEASIKGPPDIPKEQVRAFVESLDWRSKERELLNQLVLRSQALDLVPEGDREFWSRELWTPIVFDALVFFLGHLSEERLFEIFWKLGHLPREASRGEKIVAFTNKIPTFQKIAQIIARNPAIPPDIRTSLQSLESDVNTMTTDELIAYVTETVGEERLREAKLTFDDEILAEASIGVVIKVQCLPPGGTELQEAVIKVIKPYALSGLPEEMRIIDEMTQFFEENSDHYGIQDIPVTNMFRDIRVALEKEILIKEEKANLQRAGRYYSNNPRVHVPWSLPNFEAVTVMEFVSGHKITDAFPSEPQKRAIMARRLYDALTYDPLHGSQEVTLFHGDPHAGNVFHVTDNPLDPYQIALLDWGLVGTFPKQQRKQLMQIFLGLQFKHPKRLFNNISGMIEGDLPQDPEKRQRLHEIFQEVFEMENVRSVYEQISRVLELLIQEGYKLDSRFALFTKSQLTIVGILAELDPEFDQMAYSQKKVSAQVKREIPKRLLFLPAWNYHGYKSMMSNEDVKDYLFR